MMDDPLRYDVLVERALRSVVQEALSLVASHGLPDDHHFYITFRTAHPGLELPLHLKEQYPEEMTVVLQHQFYDLQIDDNQFSVTLSFNHKQERIVIPFAAITTFADPSVNFALQFQALQGADPEAVTAEDGASGLADTGSEPEPRPLSEDGKVVTLDRFRKKES